ncbi:MAG: hypothetical protein WDM76_03915 [Limisphaerales bacterium]
MTSQLPTGVSGAMTLKRRHAAFLSLLSDEDAEVYQAVRGQILAEGIAARHWLKSLMLSNEPLIRRRAQEMLHQIGSQAADNRFLTFCLNHGEEFDLETAAWLLAQTQFPDINVEAYQALLDNHAMELRERVDRHGRMNTVLGRIKRLPF